MQVVPEATLRPTAAQRQQHIREYQLSWERRGRRRQSAPLPGVALLEARRTGSHRQFSRLLGLSPSHWHRLRLGKAQFGWLAMRHVLELYPDLQPALDAGAFGRPQKAVVPAWAYADLPTLSAAVEAQLPTA